MRKMFFFSILVIAFSSSFNAFAVKQTKTVGIGQKQQNSLCHWCRSNQKKATKRAYYACPNCKISYCQTCVDSLGIGFDDESLKLTDRCSVCEASCCCKLEIWCSKDHHHCHSHRRTLQRHGKHVPQKTKKNVIRQLIAKKEIKAIKEPASNRIRQYQSTDTFANSDDGLYEHSHNGLTDLMRAVINQDEELVEVLLFEEKSYFNRINALNSACQRNNMRIVLLLRQSLGFVTFDQFANQHVQTNQPIQIYTSESDGCGNTEIIEIYASKSDNTEIIEIDSSEEDGCSDAESENTQTEDLTFEESDDNLKFSGGFFL